MHRVLCIGILTLGLMFSAPLAMAQPEAVSVPSLNGFLSAMMERAVEVFEIVTDALTAKDEEEPPQSFDDEGNGPPTTEFPPYIDPIG